MTTYSRYKQATEVPAPANTETLILFSGTLRQYLRIDGDTKRACIDKFKEYRAGHPDINDYSEVIDQTSWHKFAIDADYDVDPQSGKSYEANVAWFRDALRNICGTIIDVFISMFREIIHSSDIVVCESLDPREPLRLSAHIIIQRAVQNNRVARAIADNVIACLDDEFRSIVDCSLYARIHNLRLATCAKPNSVRVKKIPDGYALEDTLISAAACKRIPTPEVFQRDDTRDIEIPKCTQYVVSRACALIDEKYGAGVHTLRNVMGAVISFRRMRASYCVICKRTHEHDNTVYVIAHDNGTQISLREYCRHKPTKEQTLGVLEREMEEQMREMVMRPMRADFSELTAEVDEVEEYDDARMRDYPIDARTLFIRAPMKLGKTKALQQYVQQHFGYDSAKIVLVSFRRTFSFATAKTFTDFTLYTNVSGQLTLERMIVQVESLHRIAPEILGQVDLVILDESESIIEQFNSALSGQHADDFAVFQWLIENSRKVVAMDAFLSLRTISLINKMRGRRNSRLIINKHANATNYTYYFSCNYSMWIFSIFQSLERGEKIVICANSATQARALEQIVSSNFSDARVKFYTAETPTKVKENDLVDVGAIWSDCDVLIYTPTITAGVSFECVHFDRLFGYFTDKSCTAQVCMQMMGRIRNVAEKTIFIHINAAASYAPVTRDDVMLALRQRKQAIQTEAGIVLPISYNRAGLPIIAETNYAELCLQNIIARNRSRADFIGELIRLVSETGAKRRELSCATISSVFGRAPSDSEMKIYAQMGKEAGIKVYTARCTAIAESSDLDACEYLQVMSQKSGRMSEPASAGQMYAAQKYEIQRDYAYHKSLTIWHVATYFPREMREIFRNLSHLWSKYVENRMSISAALDALRKEDNAYLCGIETISQEKERRVRELSHPYVYEKHRIAHIVVRTIGFDHVFDTNAVPVEVIKRDAGVARSRLIEMFPLITANFVIPKYQEFASMDYLAAIQLAREIILPMYGMMIVQHRDCYKIERNRLFALRCNGTVAILDRDPSS